MWHSELGKSTLDIWEEQARERRKKLGEVAHVLRQRVEKLTAIEAERRTQKLWRTTLWDVSDILLYAGVPYGEMISEPIQQRLIEAAAAQLGLPVPQKGAPLHEHILSVIGEIQFEESQYLSDISDPSSP